MVSDRVSDRISDRTLGLRSVAFADRDQAEAYLSSIEASVTRLNFVKADEKFHLDYAGGSIGECSLHRGSHAGVAFSVAARGQFHMLLPLKSGLEFTSDRGTLEVASQRSGLLLPPTTAGSGATLSPFAGLSLFASENAVFDHARKLSDPDEAIDVSTSAAHAVDLRDPVFDTLGRNMISVFNEMLTLGQGGLNAIVSTHLDEMLLGLLSVAASCRIRSRIAAATASPGRVVVGRAQEYIRAHAGEPIRLADLAQSLGVGLRSLQIAFRSEIGCSPRDFLMRCRLDRARAQLSMSEGHDTVTSIAITCGFADMAHFSRLYRARFGELPSSTLRRHRLSAPAASSARKLPRKPGKP